MKKILSNTALMVAGLAAAGMIHAAELKVGAVDGAKILEAAPQAQAAHDRLMKEFTPRDEAVQASRKNLQKMEEQLFRDGATMREEPRRKLERDIRIAQRDLTQLERALRDDFAIRRSEELNKVQSLVKQVITAIAREEHFDLILTEGIVYASDRVDITGKVLQRLKSTR